MTSTQTSWLALWSVRTCLNFLNCYELCLYSSRSSCAINASINGRCSNLRNWMLIFKISRLSILRGLRLHWLFTWNLNETCAQLINLCQRLTMLRRLYYYSCASITSTWIRITSHHFLSVIFSLLFNWMKSTHCRKFPSEKPLPFLWGFNHGSNGHRKPL